MSACVFGVADWEAKLKRELAIAFNDEEGAFWQKVAAEYQKITGVKW